MFGYRKTEHVQFYFKTVYKVVVSLPHLKKTKLSLYLLTLKLFVHSFNKYWLSKTSLMQPCIMQHVRTWVQIWSVCGKGTCSGRSRHRTSRGPEDSVRRSPRTETGKTVTRVRWAGTRPWRASYAALQGQNLIPWAFLVSVHTKGRHRLNLSLSLHQGPLTRTSKHEARDSSACLSLLDGTLLLAAITAFTQTHLPGTIPAGALQPLVPGTNYPLTPTTEEPLCRSPHLQRQFTIPACL